MSYGQDPGGGEKAGVLRGKYLTFRLGNELYGIEILRVQEIIGLAPITRVPRLPDYVAGVINLRGTILPVLDLRIRFGVSAEPNTDRTCIIVLEWEAGLTRVVAGILVDSLPEVIELEAGDIQAPPSFGPSSLDIDFIRGIGRAGAQVVLVLNIDRIFSLQELKFVEQVESDDTRSDSR
jgi:purine-binding chemotaxis protein CheW